MGGMPSEGGVLRTGCAGWLFAFAWALGCILARCLNELPLVQLAD